MDIVYGLCIELLCTECVHLKKTLRLDLERESEELIDDSGLTMEEDSIPSDDIRASRILEEVDRGDLWILGCEFANHLSEKFLCLSFRTL